MALTTTSKSLFGPTSSLPTKKITGVGIVNIPSIVQSGADNTILTTTSAVISTGATTSISIVAIGEAIFSAGDRIVLLNPDNAQKHYLEINATQGASDTSLTIVSYNFEKYVPLSAYISHSEKDIIAQYQRKSRGTIAGMPVTADELGPIEYRAGEYHITGASTTYLKILPRDFMINEDGSYEALEFKDSANSGLQVGDAAQEMLATVDIPYNTKATEVAIWGSNTSKVVEVYEGGVNVNGIGSSIGSGTTNGASISITNTTATSYNYLIILVKVTATSNRVYGGRVTLTTIL